MSMAAHKILDLDGNEDLKLDDYQYVVFTIGNKRIRVRERDGYLEVSQDGQMIIRQVTSNWFEVI